MHPPLFRWFLLNLSLRAHKMVPNCPSLSSSTLSIPALSSPPPRGSPLPPRVIIQQVQLGPNVIHMRNLQIWPNVGIQRSDSGYTTNPALYWDFCRWPNPGSLVYSYHLWPNVRKPPINISSFQGSMIKTQTLLLSIFSRHLAGSGWTPGPLYSLFYNLS